MNKENIIRLSPLRQKPDKTPHIQHLKNQKQDFILNAIQQEINTNQSCHLMDVLLADPLLKQLNSSLEKQAQQQKKSKLLETFPLRYQNLVRTEGLYKKLQENYREAQKESQETIALQQSEKEELLAQIQHLRSEYDRKQTQLLNNSKLHSYQQSLIQNQHKKQLQQIQQQISLKTQCVHEAERKVIKIKAQKQNLVEYLEELKEQCEQLKKQNNRIISTITEKQIEINNLSRQYQQQEITYATTKEKFMHEIAKAEIQCEQKLSLKKKECHNLIINLQGYKTRLRECQEGIISLLNKHEQDQNQKYDQIQDVRTKLLQELKQKNQIEQEYQLYQQTTQKEMEQYRSKIHSLEIQTKEKDAEITEKGLNYEIDLNRMQQMCKRIEHSKDETIQHLKQNINLISLEKILLQGKLTKLEQERQKLAQINNRLIEEIETQKSRLKDINNHSKRSEDKSMEIQKIIQQFKHQLPKFNQIIDEKQKKIQQYRIEIINFRKKNKEHLSEKEILKKQCKNSEEIASNLTAENERLKKQIQKINKKHVLQVQQLDYYFNLLNQPKEQTEMQTQIESNNPQQIILENMSKQHQKMKLKYLNACEELQQYKKEFVQQAKEKNDFIFELEKENHNLKQIIQTTEQQQDQIQHLLNTKITELETFYEGKLQQEGKKYRSIIDVLRQEMTELYKEMDLKKSMQEEMFQDIIKIRKQKHLLTQI